MDDLFAFVIKMPIMHRLACFRDDIVFFVFLYQRHIYKVDFSRVNEYGQCQEPTEEMIKEGGGGKEEIEGEGEVTVVGGGGEMEEIGVPKKQRRGKHEKSL